MLAHVYIMCSLFTWWEGGLIIEANIPVQEFEVKEGRGLIFEGGLFSGGYGTWFLH